MTIRKNTRYGVLAVLLIFSALLLEYRYLVLLTIQHLFLVKEDAIHLTRTTLVIPSNWLLESRNSDHREQVYPLTSITKDNPGSKVRMSDYVFAIIVNHKIQSRVWISELSDHDIQVIQTRMALGRPGLNSGWDIGVWKTENVLTDSTKGLWIFVPCVAIAIYADNPTELDTPEFKIDKCRG